MAQLAQATAIANECLHELGMGRQGGSVKAEQLRGLVHALKHKDTFICLPTGFGKSYCFQVVPLASEKMGVPDVVVLVVSPLVGLSGDQVRTLNARIPGYAMHITSASDIAKAEKTKGRVLYISPELLVEDPNVAALLNTPYFKDNLHLLVFDKVHCVASWGATFRTAYNEIDSMLSLVPHKSVMAMTATSTKKLRADLSAKLRMENPVLIVGGSLNTAIHLCVRPAPKFADFLNDLLRELKVVRMHVQIRRTIIFFTNLKILEETFHHFKGLLGGKTQYTDSDNQVFRNSRIGMFHSHTHPDIKAWTLEELADPDGQLRIIFASSAFGLGIDARGIDRVVHHSCPADIDEYVQEIGRGGRGGGEVEAILFDNRSNSDDMAAYLKSSTCRRSSLCRFKELPFQSQARCCDVCDEKRLTP